MANPTITELQNKEQFELIAELNHKQIKEFVLNQLSKGGWLVQSFMIYQILMCLLGIFILIYSVIHAFANNYQPLYYLLASIAFCSSLLILIHELLHGVAIKLSGAKKVNYGAYFRKFIFYAEADRHVLNKTQFTFIALTPLVFIKFATLLAILFFSHHPIVFFLLFAMCAHSLFCAGDIGLLAMFYKDRGSDIFTFDVQSEKKSYYFRRRPF